MRKILPIIMLMFFMFGCAAMSTNISDSEKALTLTNQYNSLEQTYKSQYRAASTQEQEWLKENIAPQLDRARNLLVEYNKMILQGEVDRDTKLEIIGALRQASMRMLEVRNEE